MQSHTHAHKFTRECEANKTNTSTLTSVHTTTYIAFMESFYGKEQRTATSSAIIIIIVVDVDMIMVSIIIINIIVVYHHRKIPS